MAKIKIKIKIKNNKRCNKMDINKKTVRFFQTLGINKSFLEKTQIIEAFSGFCEDNESNEILKSKLDYFRCERIDVASTYLIDDLIQALLTVKMRNWCSKHLLDNKNIVSEIAIIKGDVVIEPIEMMRKIYGEAMLSNILDSAEAYATFNIGAELEKIIIISKSDKYSANRSKPKAFKSLSEKVFNEILNEKIIEVKLYMLNVKSHIKVA